METERKDRIIDLAGTLATRAEDFDQVLILARKKDGTGYSADNGLQAHEGVFLCECFVHWMIACVNGMVSPREET